MCKKTLAIFLLVFSFLTMNAQNIFQKLKDRTKDNAVNKVENKANEKVDNAIDSVLNGSLFKKKNKKEDSKNNETKKTPEQNDTTLTNKKSIFSSNSKYDFVTGEKVLYYDDFSRVSIGDFPADFNTNSTGEIFTIAGKEGKWLGLTKNGNFIPEAIKNLPENFTLEFNTAINGKPTNNYSGFGIIFTTIKEDLTKDMFFSNGTSVLYLHPGASEASISVLSNNENSLSLENKTNMPFNDEEESFAKVAIWRQKGRLRIYVNEQKLFDVPKFFSEPNGNYQLAFFRNFFDQCVFYINNIRYAIAAPDLRSKLLTDGKFSTTEILFDANSDKIKPESNNIIANIGKILLDHPTLNVKIIGHTDNDGLASNNIILSKKRAEAVKTRFVYGFGIDENRIITDGKGATEPLNNNKTAEEKAINRRVEFISIK
jgi:OOP family OmpA-OmpF porin